MNLLLKTGSFETDTQRATKNAERRFKELQSSVQSSAASITRAFAGIFSGAVLGISAGAIFSKFITETKNAQNEQAQLAAAIRSTGAAAGYSVSQLNEMATAFSGKSIFSEGDINRAQTRLLSYTGIVGDTFPRALQATIDTAQRMGMSVEQAAETVGRALDIPSQGLSSLSKQGFRFTEDQKQLVEQLERTGKTAEAQAVVLSALESSYGGAAEAARNTLGGAMQALQNQIDSLMTGDDGSVNGLTTSINELTNALGSEETKQAFAMFLGFLTDTLKALVQLSNEFAIGMKNSRGFVDALLTFGTTNPFNSAQENLTKYQDQLAEFQGDLERYQRSGSDTRGIEDAIRAAEKRIAYFQAIVDLEAKTNNPYAGFGETGGSPILTMPLVGVTGIAPEPKPQRPKLRPVKEEIDHGQKLIDQLERQIALTGELTERQKLQIQIEQGYINFRTLNQQELALAAADTLDFIKEQNEAYEESERRASELASLMETLYPQTGAPAEYLRNLTLLTESLQAGAISASQYSDAVERLEEKFGDTTDGMSQFSIQAARNIQSSLGDGLYDILSGNFDDIGNSFARTLLRMAADAQAAQLGKALFGDYGNTGQFGGLLGTIGKSIFGAAVGGGIGSATAADVAGAGDGLMFLDEGGYTGPGGKYDVAGVVHAGEYVINADSTRKLGLGFLSRLNGYANGGYVGNPPGSSSQAGINIETNVVVQSGGPEAGGQAAARGANQLMESITAAVRDQIAREVRQGGIIWQMRNAR